jgi:hypothetical protein
MVDWRVCYWVALMAVQSVVLRVALKAAKWDEK